MNRIVRAIAAFRPATSEAGVTSIEYGLIGMLIAIVIVAGVTLIGTNLAAVFTKVAASFPHT